MRPAAVIATAPWCSKPITRRASGAVTVIDCMPMRAQAPDLVRMVEGKRGQVRMKMELVIRFDYGSIIPWVRRIESGISAVAGPDHLQLITPVPLQNHNFTTTADFVVSAGQRENFTLIWHPSHEEVPPPIDPVVGHPRDRALVAGVVGALHLSWRMARTSAALADHAQGARPTRRRAASWRRRRPRCPNAWAAFATGTIAIAGCATPRSRSFRCSAPATWKRRGPGGPGCCAPSPDGPAETQIMYGLAGERRLPELELAWLPGYEGSRPVRIGNAASKQFQLDVYGEVMDALYHARMAGLEARRRWLGQRPRR